MYIQIISTIIMQTLKKVFNWIMFVTFVMYVSLLDFQLERVSHVCLTASHPKRKFMFYQSTKYH